MKHIFFFPLILVLSIVIFFSPFFLKGNVPIPADTIVGLYHPFRDLYAKEYPRGIPFKNFLITDPVRQQYLWRNLAISLAKEGELPLWNPYSFSGTPLLANFQTAAFYPFNILFVVMPFQLGWSLLIVLQPLLAGLFLFLYLQNLKLSKLASLLGSLVFSFCGFSTAWLEWGTIGHTALWLPLILLSIDKFIVAKTFDKRIIKWIALFILSLVSALFAGHVQIFVYLLGVSLLYFFVRWWQFGHDKKTLVTGCSAGVVFLLLTFIQWFPTVQFIVQSGRDVDQINLWQKPEWFIPWQHLIQFIAPDFFGNPTTLNYWGVWNYGEFIGYVGVFPLLMALFALYNRQDKKTFFFGSLFFLSLILSLPTIFAKIPYMWDIPFFSTTQPTRLLFITDFSLAILAALGVDWFQKTKKKMLILYPVVFLGILFGGLWISLFFGSKFFNLSLENSIIAKRNLFLPTVLFIGVTGLVFLFIIIQRFNKLKEPTVRKVQVFLLSILLLVSFGDLYRFFDKFNTFTDVHYLFPQTKTIDYLQHQQGQFRIMTTASEILAPNFSVMYRLQSLDGYDPLYLKRYGELMAALGRGKPDISAPFGFNRIITPHSIDSRLISLLGVKYIISLNELKDSSLTKVHTEGQTKVYENKEAFPRAFFTKNIESVTSKQEAITRLFNEKISLRNTAIVEGWDQNKKVFGKGSVNIVKYNENSVTLATTNKQEAFLVLMDTYYPMWHANICSANGSDCHKAPMYQTNYNFRGLVVPPGTHTVHFYITLL